MAQMLPILLFLLLLPSFTVSTPGGIRFGLTHIDSKLNLTKPELLQRAIRRTKHRIAKLVSTMSTDIQAPVQYSGQEYQTEFAIGTPSLALTWLVDTGSDLIWTLCQPNQTQAYDPSKSTTFSKLPCTSPLCHALPKSNCAPDCDYSYTYGDGSSTQGVLASETLTFGSVTTLGIGFGCSNYTDAGAGLVGLGRGELSLVSQLGSGRFSYCLTNYGESATSPLLLGSLAVLNGAAQSTPLIQSSIVPTFYYLSLQGITVGSKLLQIPSSVFALNSDGTGGFVIDSGTSFTCLEERGYQVLSQEFKAQMNLTVADASGTGFDLCFKLTDDFSPTQVPEIVFHLDGADMGFSPRNTVAIGDTGGELLCLIMLPSPPQFNGLSILGNFQQQNMHVLYDLNGGKLSFVNAQCDQL